MKFGNICKYLFELLNVLKVPVAKNCKCFWFMTCEGLVPETFFV